MGALTLLITGAAGYVGRATVARRTGAWAPCAGAGARRSAPGLGQ